MKYFSGFCFKDESKLFTKFLPKTNYCVAGFRKGAIKALEYTYNNPNQRIDRLILLSPAYFNDKNQKFIRTQLMYFKKDSKLYIDNFVANTIFPSQIDISSYLSNGKFEELEFLLNYKFEEEKLNAILENGTYVEVFLGDKDKIIDFSDAKKFFKELDDCTLFCIKDVGHILK